MKQSETKPRGLRAAFGALSRPVELTAGTPWRVILLYAAPIILSYYLQQIYTLTDAIICGQVLTAEQVAGVNDTFPLTFIFLQFAFGCTAGFSVITANCVGSRDTRGVRRSFAAQIELSLVISAFLTVLSILLLPQMLALINVTPAHGEVYTTARTYCLIIFIGTVAQIGYNLICGILRAFGDSFTPLLFLTISTLLNVGLDLLFILSFHWGVAGAAIATVAAQLISTLGCFLYAFLKYPELRLHREDWRITRRDVTRHLIQGIPLGLQFSVLAIGIIVMQSVIVQFDTLGGEMVSNAAQNGFGAANKLNNLLMTPLNGLGAAMTSFTAQNLGAGDHARIKKGTVQALIIVWTMCLISIAAGLLLSRGGGYLYIFLSPDKVTAETMRYGNTYLYVDLSLYLFLGFIFVVRNCVQGIGKPQFVLGAGAAELAARVSVCLLLPPLIAGGPVNSDAPRAAVYALCFADPFAWMAADAVLLVPFLRNIMKMDYRYLKGTM